MNNHPNIPEEVKGKEKVIFGNMRELLTFHKENFAKEIAKCDNTPDKVASLFLKSVCISCSVSFQRKACLRNGDFWILLEVMFGSVFYLRPILAYLYSF